MKKSILLSLLMLAASFSASAYDFMVDGIAYNIMNNTAVVTYNTENVPTENAHSSYQGIISIPEQVTYNGTSYTVAGIGNRAFAYCYMLSGITLPEKLTTVKDSAFFHCDSVKVVTIPQNVTNIGVNAFSYTAISEITIPNGVKTMGIDAFSNCSNLILVNYNASNCLVFGGYLGVEIFPEKESFFYGSPLKQITIGSKVKRIPYCLAYGQADLTSIILPNSVSIISSYAFKECTGLTKITIPKSVQNIGTQAFMGCTGLKSVTLPETSTIGIVPQIVNLTFESSAFEGCTGLTEVYIPNGVNGVGQLMFRNCINLKKVTINNKVTSIGYGAFSGCSSLESFPIHDAMTAIDGQAFYGCVSTPSEVSIPRSLKYLGSRIFEGCTGLTTVNFNAVNCQCENRVDYACFRGCSLTTLNIGEGVESIPNFFTYNQKNIMSIGLPSSLKIIGDNAFRNTPGLTEIIIPDSVISIGKNAFSSCWNLKKMSIGKSVDSIGGKAFYNCPNITTVISRNVVPPSFESIPFSSESYTNATLYVPNGAKERYAAADYWKDFAKVAVRGDVNNSGVVDVTDVNLVTKIILGSASMEEYPNADLTGDGKVDVTDINLLISIILE